MPTTIRATLRGARHGLAALVFFFATSAGAADPAPLPVLGVDQLTSGTIVETHADALPHWAEAGFKKAAVLHVDAHHGLFPSGAAHTSELARLYADGALTAGRMSRMRARDGFFDELDFLRAAFELGIVGKVYWIVPLPLPGPLSTENRFIPFLENSGFSASDLAGFKYLDGCFAGTYGGVALTICGQESLPAIDEPVLLSIDADYFTTASLAREKPFLDLIGDFFRNASRKNYRVRDALLSYSVEGGYVSAENRWVGDAVLDYMRSPGILNQAEPPPDFSILQKAATLAAKDRFGDVEAAAKDYLSHFASKSPAMLFTLAYAQLMLGKTDYALANATTACKGDPGYCYGLLELGIIMTAAGKTAGGELFFKTAYEVNPSMSYGEVPLAMALVKAKEFDRAAAVFEKLKNARPGSFYDLDLGAILLEKGDEAGALARFDEAAKAVERASADPFPNPVSPRDLTGAARVAAIFYEEKGMPAKAALLRKFFGLGRSGQGLETR